jgi:hypothetical protein
MVSAMIRRFLLLLVSLLGVAVPASAQYPDEFEGSVDESKYSELVLTSPTCTLRGLVAGHGLFHADCFGDPSVAQQEMNEAKGVDRWLRAGVLTFVSIWAQFEQAKDLFTMTRNNVRAIEALLGGWRDDRSLVFVVQLASSTDHLARVAMANANAQKQFDFSGPDNRFGVVGTVVGNALGIAEAAHLTAASLSEQTTRTMLALNPDADVDLLALGTDEDRNAMADLPPLPLDAPADAETFYAQLLSSGTGGGMSGVGGPQGVSGRRARTQLVTYAPISIQMRIGPGGPQMAAGNPLCTIDSETLTPQVMFERAAAAAKGSQTAVVGVRGEVGTTRDEVRMVSDREREESRMRRLLGLLRFYQNF